MGEQAHTQNVKDNMLPEEVCKTKEKEARYGPWTTVQNKRNIKPNRGKQKDDNARINEYSKCGSGRVVNMQNNQPSVVQRNTNGHLEDQW